jgi:hypothetical protein
METREIPGDEWTTFFDTFSRQHEGWLASVEIFGSNVGAQKEASNLPLEGVMLASGSGEPQAITISLGKNPDDHVSHTVLQPTHVWLEQTTDGANAALEIESADETKTLLRFRSPISAEMVDGVVLD